MAGVQRCYGEALVLTCTTDGSGGDVENGEISAEKLMRKRLS